MKIARSQADLRRFRRAFPRGASCGFVPTMGALHAGHGALVARARRENDICAASIFVNPKQFGPGEDFESYPRTEDADLAMLRDLGSDLVLIGTNEDLYPEEFATRVELKGPLVTAAEGARRPTHFAGVTTVVAKLFGLFEPTRAYFGWKDMQQLLVIRRMVDDLSIPVEVVGCEIVREDDGVAMSSRNRYLDREARMRAPKIHEALVLAARAWQGGERRAERLRAMVREHLHGFDLEYVELRSTSSFEELQDPVGPGRILVVARMETTRLLDNYPLDSLSEGTATVHSDDVRGSTP
ncbi:MAG: pantoate--beta-alanine ligase [Planctomycetes bacterium]|nr:pantoate--beta-alanine ligase [Planctomycetota bacterium]MCB9918476.1 pantoate--beta-alanine ligase [Planctomycetota bacterium]